MMDWERLIERLEDENSRVDTTDAQKSLNQWRIKWIRLSNRSKSPETPYVRLEPVQERLKDDSYTITPNKLLKE